MNKETNKPRKPAMRKTKPPAARKFGEKDDMLDDYSSLDWSKAERGKYVKRYAEGTNLVLIEPDLRKVFPTAEAVNRALRAMVEVIRASSAKPPKRRAG